MLNEVLRCFDPLCVETSSGNDPNPTNEHEQPNYLISNSETVFCPSIQPKNAGCLPEIASENDINAKEQLSNGFLDQMNDLYASDSSSYVSSCSNSPDENVAPTSIFSNILNLHAEEETIGVSSSVAPLNENSSPNALYGLDLFEADQLRKATYSRAEQSNFTDLVNEFDTLNLAANDDSVTETEVSVATVVGETGHVESPCQQDSEQEIPATASCFNPFSGINVEQSRESNYDIGAADVTPCDRALKELYVGINLNLACNNKTDSSSIVGNNQNEPSSSENRKAKKGRQIPTIKNVLSDNTVICTYDEDEIPVQHSIPSSESSNSDSSCSVSAVGLQPTSTESAIATTSTDLNENCNQFEDQTNGLLNIESTISPENRSIDKSARTFESEHKNVLCPDLEKDFKFEESVIEMYGLDEYSNFVKYVDAHCHLDLLFDRVQFDGSFTEFKKLYSPTWSKFYHGCITSHCFPSSFQEKRAFFDSILLNADVKATIGCHPHQADKYNNDVEDFIISKLSDDKFIAYGECGLDFSSKNCVDHKLQISVLQRQLRLAVAFNKPIVLHCRLADNDCFNILKKVVPHDHPMHLHSFTGDVAMFIKLSEYFPRLYFGVTPALCSPRNNLLNEFIDIAPINRLIIETDAPYFLPEKYKMNQFRPCGLQASHPGLGSLVAQKIAEIRSIPVDTILDQLFRNTQRLYDSFH